MSETELAPVVTDKEILLVPNSGVQYLDLALTVPEGNARVDLAYNRAGLETTATDATPSAPGADAARVISLVRRDGSGDGFLSADNQAVSSDHVFSVDLRSALDAVKGRWLPLPFLRKIQESNSLQDSPTNWVRAFIQELDAPCPAGSRYRLVMVVDTTINSRSDDTQKRTPQQQDVSESVSQFEFPRERDALSRYLSGQDWVAAFCEDTIAKPERIRGAPPVLTELDDRAELERFKTHFPFAIYAAWLSLLPHIVTFPVLRFLDTLSENASARVIPVDLVLDVGNSRTCGILFEDAGERRDLNDCYNMKLRDLSSPAFLHEGPFSSRLEFSDHAYGVGKAEKVDGRVLFEWPSPVRLGPEATRLSGQIFGNEGQMGVASPKRFIWDTSRSINTWHLNPYGRPKLATDIEAQPRKAFKGSVPQKLTDEGELVGSGQLPTVEPQYSRSSLTTFLLIELIQQAFCQVNAAYVRYSRGHRNRPRRLRKIILTVPTAMTLEERLLFHRRAANACKILWPLVGEKRPDVSVTLQEQLNDQWDEAVATQAVFLYGETVGRFKESMDDFFQTSGAIRSLPQKLREDIRDAGHADVVPEEAPCLRLASLDIGGGTTDLIVTSYYLVNKGIYPVQNFREGFNVAGDDILGELVQKVVLPALALSLENEGHPAPLELINDLVGPDREGATIAADSNMRRQFCGHILIPIALRLIDLYENPGAEPNGVSTISIDDLATADDRARSQLDQHARRKDERGGRIFETSLFDLSITASAQSVEDVVSSVMGSVVIDLAEIVYAHSCDFLLLAGRPSRLPALKKILLSHLPIAPHRLIPMHDYRVGPWYPFQRIDNRVHDPKMTVSVGAMICAMSEGVLQNFFLHSNRLHMRSTARHIGPVRNYRIEPSEVYFADVDFDSDDMAGAIIEKEISFTYPTQIGFRQMRHGRWQATPYYDLRYSDETMGEAVRPQAPIRVTLSLKVPSEKDPTALTITSAEDATGRSVKSALSLRLQTLSAAGRKGEQHWLDAGIFDVNQVQEFMAMFRHSSSSKTS